MSEENKDMTEEIKTALEDNNTEQLVTKSEIEFDFEDKKFKVVKPTFKNKNDAFLLQLNKYNELLKIKGNLLEDNLKRIYKENQNIDIDEYTKDIEKLSKSKDNLLLKLGELIKLGKSETECEKLRLNIKEIDTEIIDISMKKNDLLKSSIESQSKYFSYQFLTSELTYVLDNGEWKKYWKNMDEFLNSKNGVVNIASFYTSILTGQL